MDKLIQKLPPLNKSRLIKKFQEEEDEIKRNPHKANKACIDWKFQIHWNKLEWVNPKSRDEGKNSFCVSS